MRKLLLLLFAFFGAAIATQPAMAADTVYVVRHLQKAEGTDIVARFGGTPVPLTEQDYGTVFVVKPGRATVDQILLKATPERGQSSCGTPMVVPSE